MHKKIPSMERPVVTVAALILNSKGEALFVKSHKWGDKLTVPGGKVEHGEKLEKALKREMKEETGLSIKDIRFVNVQEAISPVKYYKGKHFIFLDFICRATSTNVKLDKKELHYFEWIKPKKALKLNLDRFTRKLVKDYLRNIK